MSPKQKRCTHPARYRVFYDDRDVTHCDDCGKWIKPTAIEQGFLKHGVDLGRSQIIAGIRKLLQITEDL